MTKLLLSKRRVLIEDVRPEIDSGRYPVKREVGDRFVVSADIFMDGHDMLRAAIRWSTDGKVWQTAPMQFVDNDRWSGAFDLTQMGCTRYTIEAWPDEYGTWARDTEKKRAAGQDIRLELREGELLLRQILPRAKGLARRRIEDAIGGAGGADAAAVLEMLSAPDLVELVGTMPDKREVDRYSRELVVEVDRVGARFSAWYEMFPRSQGTDPTRGATFADCAKRLPEIRAMGFDVIYFVPIHPIGRTNRKGPNNSLHAGPHDPGSPYAIGAREGGHDAVHPELGTLEDFRSFVTQARQHDMEVALDFAVQCSPDHPWVKLHKDWFKFRPDGSIKYAENPPKKYQDIVNVDFHGADAEGLWLELKRVVLFWVDQGVKLFRVDNPHTKPFAFWEWLIAEVRSQHPDVIFLAEAFTRPKVMRALGKLGFGQSYTYFTWRNTKAELTEYLIELSQGPMREYYRPHFFPTTPDIMPYYLQTSGRPGFIIRLALAATLSPLYGMYNGYELCEDGYISGKEEYSDSEKYQYKVWDWDRPGNIKSFVTALNRARRENSALHHLDNLRFYTAQNDQVLFYGKIAPDRSHAVFAVVNLDPHNVQEAWIGMPLDDLGLPQDRPYVLTDLLDGHEWQWTGSWQFQHLDPRQNPVALFRVSLPSR